MSQIGNDIRRARESKNLSVEDVANKTKISPTIINDIENGKFDLYTGDEPYVRMYIKKISLILGLDGYELTQQYDSLSQELKKELDEEKTEETPTVAKQMSFKNPNYARNPSVYEDRSHITLIRGGILLLLICLVVGIVWFAIVSTRNDISDFEEPGTTHVEGNVPVEDTDKKDENQNVVEQLPSAEIEKVADYDYKFRLTGDSETFVIKIEFMNPSWAGIFYDQYRQHPLEGFNATTYGPKSANVIANNAEALKQANEQNPAIKITQSEEKEIVELTMNKEEFSELLIRTGYTKGQRFYINDVELVLSENEAIEGVANLHIALDKE